MILYLIRHAQAVEQSKTLPDQLRYLTKHGRSTVKKLRSKIVQNGPEPCVIITSPFVRAVQTAEILAEKVQQNDLVIASRFLQPDTDRQQLIKYLKTHKNTECVMVVGHEPLLSLLVTELLGQTDETIHFKKGACVALNVHFDNNKKTSFLWYMAPGKKWITSFKKAFLQK